jgi:hypothetical protein
MDNNTSTPQANQRPGDFSPVRLRQRQKFARSRDGCFTCKYEIRSILLPAA